MKNRKTNKQGFSLLEIMIAALVISVLVLAQSAAFTFSSNVIQQSHNRRTAVSIATSMMEKNIYDIGLAQLKQAAVDNGNSTQSSETVSVDGTDYTTSTTVKLIGNNVQVRVKVDEQRIEPLTLFFEGLIN